MIYCPHADQKPFARADESASAAFFLFLQWERNKQLRNLTPSTEDGRALLAELVVKRAERLLSAPAHSQ